MRYTISLAYVTKDTLENGTMTPADILLSPPHPYAAIYPIADHRNLRSLHIHGNIKYYIKQRRLLGKDAALSALVKASR